MEEKVREEEEQDSDEFMNKVASWLFRDFTNESRKSCLKFF